MKTYSTEVIHKGNLASRDLGELRQATRNFCREEIKCIGGDYLLRPSIGHNLAVFPARGRETTDPQESAAEFVCDAAEFAKRHKFEPIALTDILEVPEIKDESLVSQIKKGLYDSARECKVWVATGETAVHGQRVCAPFSICGHMLAYTKKEPGIYQIEDRQIAVVSHQDLLVQMNSDGNGTKPEFGERLESLGLGFADSMLQDGFAMRWDDAIKLYAKVVMDGTRLELGRPSGRINRYFQGALWRWAEKSRVYCTLDTVVTDKIRGYGLYPMSLSGTCVSLVDPHKAYGMPKPSDSQAVVGFYSRLRNIRCNGITDNRHVLVKEMGDDWHNTQQGGQILEAVFAPSAVFYHFFRELYARNLVSLVGHFSGGAYDGKFAKALGRHGLGADLAMEGHAFPIQDMLVRLQQHHLQKDFQTICANQPYRLEAWALTDSPDRLISRAKDYGYVGLCLGTAERMDEPILRMTFRDINKTVEYWGRESEELHKMDY